jgi:peptidyl-dipeptidase A
VAEAKSFMDQVEAELLRRWIARDRAAWVSENFITDDSEALSAAAEAETAAYAGDAIKRAQRYSGLQLPAPLARRFELLKLAQTVPAPAQREEAQQLATAVVSMIASYGKAQVCPSPGSKLAGPKGECLRLDELSDILATSRDEPKLREAWTHWHDSARDQRAAFDRYVELANKGAREIGFDDLGALWRAGYDMSPAELQSDIERLWQQVKPLYDSLHCFARARLRNRYGAALVPVHGPIPAHLLGNMWAQEWVHLEDLLLPFPKETGLDLGKRLVAQKVDPKQMVRMGESFFTSLGFTPLPDSFWERSLFTRPRDREVVCHASAWDPTWSNDLRIKMCIKPTEEDLITIHHELGHLFYMRAYSEQPLLFRQGANDGFHEGIGDTLALSVTPSYLRARGLLERAPNQENAALNQQMRMALGKVAFLPFGLLIDRWRWDVFAGKIPKDKYNESFWELKRKYQGVAPPLPRTAADFDPAAKFHIASSTPYLRYFLAAIYQFQFHRALCRAAGHTGPLEQCSIYQSAPAGEKLRAMLTIGASQPWQDALAALSGERAADASALLEYFAPLNAWLAEQTRNESCGF